MRPSDIITAREALGLTQEEVAARARVSEQSVSRIERGVRVRPNTLKDVCAVLNLPYDGLDTTVLVMPDRLKDDPDTATLLTAAATLPDIRYLARPDPVGWADYIWSIIRENPVRGICTRTSALTLILCFCTPLAFWFPVWLAVEDYQFSIVDILIIVTIAGVCIWFGYWIASEDYKELWICKDHRLGYAFSDDAVWELKIQPDRIAGRRISHEEATERHVKRDGPFLEMYIYVHPHSIKAAKVPYDAGLADLMTRPRTTDRSCTIPMNIMATRGP